MNVYLCSRLIQDSCTILVNAFSLYKTKVFSDVPEYYFFGEIISRNGVQPGLIKLNMLSEMLIPNREENCTVIFSYNELLRKVLTIDFRVV